MVSTKKTSSKSKSLSSSHKKGKLGLPMKKQSPKKLSPMKSTVVTSSRRSNYQHMVTEALTKLDSRKGSSRSKIFNHMKSTYGIEHGKNANNHLRSALEVLLKQNIISLAKGTGYSNGYYKITAKGKKPNEKRSSSKKKQQQRSLTQSQTGDSNKTSGKISRSRPKAVKHKQTDHQQRSRSNSKGHSRSSSKKQVNKVYHREEKLPANQSRSPSRTKSIGRRKSTTSNQTKSRRSVSHSPSKSKMEKNSQQQDHNIQVEHTKSLQRGRPQGGQQRQALKEVNEYQLSEKNKDKQHQSKSSKKKLSDDSGHTSSTNKIRNSTNKKKIK